MATALPIMPAGPYEAPSVVLSPLLRSFTELLSALDHHIACERDLDGVDLFDPAWRYWLDKAEAAQLQLYDALASSTRLSPDRAEEIALQRMATLVREGTNSAFRRYAELERSFADFLTVPGDGLDAARVRQMLAAAGNEIRAMAGLSVYRQDGAHPSEAEGFCAAA